MNRFYVRQFLNRRGHHAGAYVLAFVERTEATQDPDVSSYVKLEVTDCFHRVNLDFPMWTARDRNNSVRKARMLADVLTRFADALEVEAEIARERSKRRSHKRDDNPFL